MKKVRKQDLEELILHYYQMFIECAPDYELEETVTVDINSIYITVMDYRDFNDVETKMKAINDFDKKLKKVTFGNLYVAYMEVKNDKVYNNILSAVFLLYRKNCFSYTIKKQRCTEKLLCNFSRRQIFTLLRELKYI